MVNLSSSYKKPCQINIQNQDFASVIMFGEINLSFFSPSKKPTLNKKAYPAMFPPAFIIN